MRLQHLAGGERHRAGGDVVDGRAGDGVGLRADPGARGLLGQGIRAGIGQGLTRFLPGRGGADAEQLLEEGRLLRHGGAEHVAGAGQGAGRDPGGRGGGRHRGRAPQFGRTGHRQRHQRGRRLGRGEPQRRGLGRIRLGRGLRGPDPLGLVPLGSVPLGSVPLGLGDLPGDLPDRRERLGHCDLGRGNLGRGNLGRGNLGRGSLGRGNLGRGNLGRGDLELGRQRHAPEVGRGGRAQGGARIEHPGDVRLRRGVRGGGQGGPQRGGLGGGRGLRLTEDRPPGQGHGRQADEPSQTGAAAGAPHGAGIGRPGAGDRIVGGLDIDDGPGRRRPHGLRRDAVRSSGQRSLGHSGNSRARFPAGSRRRSPADAVSARVAWLAHLGRTSTVRPIKQPYG
ncbi:pentapeptide repeat-containing protein [Methylobacterium sp. J-030]|uniref:pentapeptide repeat-containing protein n=1 Tax=Methylobacterium sp. J-030 TaxID=2836627 RepID=UPI00391C21DD